MIRLITSQQQHAALAGWRAGPMASWCVIPSEPGELRVVFLHTIVKYDEVRPLFDWLLSEPAPAWQMVTLDFGLVRDIAAPWAPVFAHLEYVAARTGVRCRLVGMSERLTGMASFAMLDAITRKPEPPASAAAQRAATGQC